MNQQTRDNAAIARAGFKEFGSGITSEIDKIIMQAGLIVQNAAQKKFTTYSAGSDNPSSDTGLLRASITTRLDKTDDKISAEIGTNLAYAPSIEFGTSPHRVSFDELKNWGHRKGMSDSEIDAVANHIAKFGTRPKPFLTPALEENRTAANEKIADGIKKYCDNYKGEK